MVKAWGHINITVRDLDKTIDFYTKILGLKFAFQIKDEEGNIVVTYLSMADGNFVELIHGKKMAEGAKAFNAAHMCFEVDSLEETMSFFKENGVEIVGGPREGRDKNLQCFITDPDGNRIEMMQMSPDSPQRKCQKEIRG